jgi:hypothetical protein
MKLQILIPHYKETENEGMQMEAVTVDEFGNILKIPVT